MIRTLAPTGTAGSGCTGQSRAQHLLDLLQVALDGRLVADLQNVDEAIAAEGAEPVVLIAEQEKVTRKQRDDGANFPALRRAIFFENLGKEKRDGYLSEFPSGGLLLARLGVQAPPAGLCLGLFHGRQVVPEVGGKKSGSAGKIGMIVALLGRRHPR